MRVVLATVLSLLYASGVLGQSRPVCKCNTIMHGRGVRIIVAIKYVASYNYTELRSNIRTYVRIAMWLVAIATFRYI